MKKILLSLITVLVSISVIAQSAADLKLNLEKNKVYRFKSSSEQSISQTINGAQQTTIAKTNSTLSLKMVDATPDFIIAEVRFDTLLTSTNAMGKITDIKSTSEGNIKSTEMADVMSCIMNRLSKNSLYVKMDYVGKVIEIVNSKMLSALILKDTSSITGETAAVIKMQVKNSINDKAFKTMVETFTYNLPGKQVSAGDKWDITVAMNSGGMSLDIMTSYDLEEISNNAATITATSNVKASENADPMEFSGARITYDNLGGLAKSNMVIDIRTGLLLDNSSRMHIAGDLGITGPGFSMQMPMVIDGETRVFAVK